MERTAEPTVSFDGTSAFVWGATLVLNMQALALAQGFQQPNLASARALRYNFFRRWRMCSDALVDNRTLLGWGAPPSRSPPSTHHGPSLSDTGAPSPHDARLMRFGKLRLHKKNPKHWNEPGVPRLHRAKDRKRVDGIVHTRRGRTNPRGLSLCCEHTADEGSLLRRD